MAEPGSISIQEVCRTCFSAELVSPFQDIEIDGLSVCFLLKDTLSIEVDPDDDLPHNICDICLNELYRSYVFRRKCKQVDATLRFLVENKQSAMIQPMVNTIQITLVDSEASEPAVDIKEEKEDEKTIKLNEDMINNAVVKIEALLEQNEASVCVNEPNPIDDNICDICRKPFFGKAALRKHRLKEHADVCVYRRKKYLCSYCGQGCRTLSALQIHMRKHTGEKPHICPFCPKAFSFKQTLRNHMNIHTGERPYKCELCDRAFIQSQHLHNHIKSHTKEKPYVCAVCGKGFGLNGNLKTHLRIHTGEKPYKCEVCSEVFSNFYSFRNHRKTHKKD